MSYKRQIAYLDYTEFGEKKGSGGFCKWEQKNGMHTLEISINGLKQKVPENVKIFTRMNSELGEIQIRNGRAIAFFSKKEDEGNWNWEFSRIKIILGEERELVTEFPVEADALEVRTGTVELVDRKMTQVKPEEIMVLELDPNKEEKEPEVIGQETSDYERVPEAEVPEEEYIQGPELSEEPPLHSLWDCLVRTHKLVYPFGTDAEYCRIMLEDIFLLKERFHILRNNQFLLHGYYNYKYLILGKKSKDSEEYWLGVPGIYHEREKMAARMYGFEKFEGAKPRYGIGDLGYYLITVE